ncbi:hypothetical protein GCM10011371_02770 [Novosphingobium marinum]|uniref:YCII-related domain-containing protein n=1 Tax=Novosphingobium marinum TaxID=1514948 RepID=A0A7Y9XT09_9SPHN|nr:YciI family protein [Novosphingobium marinum]NYH93969.1 hypothetical protein [Novosphingobium marinum]GGC18636.1 hypothetical protein GCM10011371_02770 [Novosphingobium marinum]
MHFLVLARDADGASALRTGHRQRHVDYWIGQGSRLKVAGAMMSDDGEDAVPVGSSFLIEASDESEVRELIAGDPFTTEGIFGSDVTVQRIRPAIGEWFAASAKD